MKRTFLCVFLIILICGCEFNTVTKSRISYEKTVGVWISLFEMKSVGLNKVKFKEKFNIMFDNIKEIGGTDVFCHIRPAGDAYYKSSYYPFSAGLTGTEGKSPGFDPMKILIKLAHKKGLKFHAWINPYRVSSVNDITELAESNFARIWLTDNDTSNDTNVRIIEKQNGKVIYFNPASLEVQKLILNGVREILNNYKVDGIHMDDYFYPTTAKSFDSQNYKQYCKTISSPLTLSEWRRTNVDSLVSAIYRICKQNDVLFGISPSAHISDNKTDKNYTEQYADIAKWISHEGFVDYIAPQIYFGYDYPAEEYKFDYLLNLWLSLKRNNSVKIYIGLGNYKIGEKDLDSTEWIDNNDIIARQTNDSFNSGADGVLLFSYTAIFDSKKANVEQTENLKKVLQN